MANLKKTHYTDKENLKMAFDFFDEDKNGSICLKELKKVFENIQEEATIINLIKEYDINKDGEVI